MRPHAEAARHLWSEAKQQATDGSGWLLGPYSAGELGEMFPTKPELRTKTPKLTKSKKLPRCATLLPSELCWGSVGIAEGASAM